MDKHSPRFISFVEMYRSQMKTLRDPYIMGAFLFKDDQGLVDGMDNDEFLSVMNEGCAGGYAILSSCEDLVKELDDDENFGKNVFEAFKLLHDSWPSAVPVKLNYLIKPLRYALSGGFSTPPIDKVLFVLGKKVALNRIRLCIARYDDG